MAKNYVHSFTHNLIFHIFPPLTESFNLLGIFGKHGVGSDTREENQLFIAIATLKIQLDIME